MIRSFGMRPTGPLTPYLRNTVLCAIAGILAVTAYAAPSGGATALRVFGLAVIVSLAAFWLVGLFGFVFGVPRASGSDNANQSLQEISDWLTKLIVGASLAQLSEIVRGVASIGATINADLQVAGGEVVFSALVVAEATAGFIFFYFWAFMYWDALQRAARGES